jgi:hypothetical protein
MLRGVTTGRRWRRARQGLGLAMIMLLAGCAGAPSGTASGMAVMGPPPGKAMVVFLRPALLDKAAASPVLDISAEPPMLVGVIAAGRKIAYLSDPGTRRFMVMGEAADFMDAELHAGRIYYARIAPHQGTSSGRFALHPVAASDIALASELGDCSWADEAARPGDWVEEHLATIDKEKAAGLPAWAATQHSVLKADTP